MRPENTRRKVFHALPFVTVGYCPAMARMLTPAVFESGLTVLMSTAAGLNR